MPYIFFILAIDVKYDKKTWTKENKKYPLRKEQNKTEIDR